MSHTGGALISHYSTHKYNCLVLNFRFARDFFVVFFLFSYKFESEKHQKKTRERTKNSTNKKSLAINNK